MTPAGGSAATHLKERFVNLVVAAATTRDFALTAGVQVNGTIRDDPGQLFSFGFENELPRTAQATQSISSYHPDVSGIRIE